MRASPGSVRSRVARLASVLRQTGCARCAGTTARVYVNDAPPDAGTCDGCGGALTVLVVKKPW